MAKNPLARAIELFFIELKGGSNALPPLGLEDDEPECYADAFGTGEDRFKQPEQPLAVPEGWSKRVGLGANELVPRAGAPWTPAEEVSLIKGLEAKRPLEELAHEHGRTEHALECRMHMLGVDVSRPSAEDDFGVPYTRLIDTDYSALEARVCGMLYPSTSEKEYLDMKMTTHRALILFAAQANASIGVASLPRYSTFAPDLAFLEMGGLMARDAAGCPIITQAGREWVNNAMASMAETSGTGLTPSNNVQSCDTTRNNKSPVAWDGERGVNHMTVGKMYLVASGDCTVGSFGPKLSKPPVQVQLSHGKAASEAIRLAESSPGQTFFVLEAVEAYVSKPAKPTIKKFKW